MEEVGDGLPVEEVGDGLPVEVGAGAEDTGLVSSWLLVLEPATQSVSKFLLMSVTTLALMWKVPQGRPSWIV